MAQRSFFARTVRAFFEDPYTKVRRDVDAAIERARMQVARDEERQSSCGVQPAAPTLSAADAAARIAFRDGEQPGVLEIISVDAEGKCVVHRVAGLALINLAFKAVDQIKRGAK